MNNIAHPGRLALALLACIALLLSGCGDATPESSQQQPALTAEELSWDELVPPDWEPEAVFDGVDIETIADEDPRAIELMDRLRAIWKQAPVVPELDGREVRLPGFVLPVNPAASVITQFLLVPYVGACIHDPPPPANQTVLVTTPAGEAYPGGVFDTVWVEGTIRVQAFDSPAGAAGYRIDNARVLPYDTSE